MHMAMFQGLQLRDISQTRTYSLAFCSGMYKAVNFHVLPPSGVDIIPPVAPEAQEPVCWKRLSA